MAAGDIVPVPGAQFEETLASASPDVLRAMIREFAQRMMDADVEVACNAGYGEVSPDRVNSRNGYRRREWDTRAGTIELAIPKLRQGSYFPGFLEHRRRAERALASVVATSYLLGVSTRRVEKLAASLGVVGLSKSQVSAMAAELDELVESFRNRPLDRGPYTFVWIDALTQKVREGGRTVNVHCLIATGVNADGCREILGIDVTSSEDGAGWLAFLRGLAARGLSGVRLVTSDDHAGLVNAIAAVLPGAACSGAGRTITATCSPGCPRPPSRGSRPWSGPSSSNPTPSQSAPSTPRSSPRWRLSCRRCRAPGRGPRGHPGVHRLPPRGMAADLVQQPPGAAQQEVRRRTTCRHLPGRGAIIRLVARCWPSRTTNGPNPAAIWAWKSWPPTGRPPKPISGRISLVSWMTVEAFLLKWK